MMHLAFALLIMLVSACGRSGSQLLRTGQAPVYGFPMYVSSGAPGQVLKFSADGSREVFVSGLSDPRGLAADRFGNLYVAEQGANRVTRIRIANKEQTVIASGLSTPSVLAVNSVGEVFVAQDGANNIIRVNDSKVFATFNTLASALAFGVNDTFLVGLLGADLIQWGLESDAPSVTVTDPVNISTDATGRVYVAEGITSNARVLRYHQRQPGNVAIMADALNGPAGIAVDASDNVYIIEQGAARIVLVTHDQKLFVFASSITDPYYLVFTQY